MWIQGRIIGKFEDENGDNVTVRLQSDVDREDRTIRPRKLTGVKGMATHLVTQLVFKREVYMELDAVEESEVLAWQQILNEQVDEYQSWKPSLDEVCLDLRRRLCGFLDYHEHDEED